MEKLSSCSSRRYLFHLYQILIPFQKNPLASINERPTAKENAAEFGLFVTRRSSLSRAKIKGITSRSGCGEGEGTQKKKK